MLSSARLVPVVGKGGVGRSTVTLALALAAEAEGRRTLIVEMGGTSDIPSLIERDPVGYTPQALTDRIDIMTLSALDCLADFGHRKMKLPAFVDPMFRSRPLTAFVQGVPGLQDLLQLGKVEDLLHHPRAKEPRYDLCVLDAPATGHGLTLLGAPGTLRELTHSGPFSELAHTIEAFLHSEQTVLVGVTLPEALPVAESIELSAQLGTLGLSEAAWIVTRTCEHALPETPEWGSVRRILSQTDCPELLALAERVVGRRAMQKEALDRLRQLDRDLTALTDTPSPPRTLEAHRSLAAPLRRLFRTESSCPS
jgi:hypothetical protein